MGEAARVGIPVVQANHGFARATVVRFDGTNWVKALAGSGGLRLVGSIIDQDTFQAVQLGELDGMDGFDITPGTQYYASPTIAGAWTTVVNTSPLFRAYTTSIVHIENLAAAVPASVSGNATSADLATAIAIEVSRATTADVAAIVAANAHSDAALAAAIASLPTITTVTGEAVALINGTVDALPIGTPVYITAASTIDKARANAVSTAKCIGLVADLLINPSVSGNVRTDGKLTATTGQWDAVTGGVGGLTTGALYFLDPNSAGKITTTPPTFFGQLVQRLGRALSLIDLLVQIEDPILL